MVHTESGARMPALRPFRPQGAGRASRNKAALAALFSAMLALSASGCGNSPPQLLSIHTAGSAGELVNNDKTAFSVGEWVFIGVTAYDFNWDITKFMLVDTDSGEEKVYTFSQSLPGGLLYAEATGITREPGTRNLGVYLVDSKGNKSNTLTVSITITE